MNARLNKLYEDIYSIEGQLDAAEQKKQAIAQNILTLDTVLKMLGAFGEMFDQMTAEDKRKLMETLIAEIQLHPKDLWREGQSPIKMIKYTFPISREGVSAFLKETEFAPFGENDWCVTTPPGVGGLTETASVRVTGISPLRESLRAARRQEYHYVLTGSLRNSLSRCFVDGWVPLAAFIGRL